MSFRATAETAPNESIRERFSEALNFEQYLETVDANADLWKGIYNRYTVAPEFVEKAESVEKTWHLLALTEDWCGDAVNVLPVIARFADAAPKVDLRLLSRDDNLDIMDAHLTGGKSRSIPVVIAYDENFVERAWWGPRPTAIQTWVIEEGLKMDPEPRYKHVRTLYARDKGRSILEEILAMLKG